MGVTKKLIIGGLCVLAGAAVQAELWCVRTDLRQAKADLPANTRTSAIANVLITPVSFQAHAAAAEPPAIVDEPAATQAAVTDERFALYVHLHNTRVEHLP